MYSWVGTWSVRYNVLWSLTDILLGFCGRPGCIFGESPFFSRGKSTSFASMLSKSIMS